MTERVSCGVFTAVGKAVTAPFGTPETPPTAELVALRIDLVDLFVAALGMDQGHRVVAECKLSHDPFARPVANKLTYVRMSARLVATTLEESE
jgi:hypothetical protein